MTRVRPVAALAVLAALATAAAAQVPQPSELTAAALEQRVPDELATEGVVLASQGLSLQIKPIGDRWLVSLVAVSTGRAVITTRVDRLPADRDAAVAVMTDVVANLVARALDASAPAPAPPPPDAPPVAPPSAPAPAPPPPPGQSELAYQHQALRFAAMYDLDDRRGEPSVQRRWLVFQGDPGRSLSTEEFYRVLGRDDLAGAYRARHRWRIAGGVTATVGLLAAAVLGVDSLDHGCLGFGCSALPADFVVPILVSLGVGLAGIALVVHARGDAAPLDEANARALADAYNQRLRARLGLPPRTAHRAPIRAIALVPLIDAGNRGLVLRATF